ncbi:MAG: DNA polymerase Y family protein [Xylophilus ampelinus]
MLWAALLPATPNAAPPTTDTLAGLAVWCLQFTPRVALAEDRAVVMELEASARLFGGRRALALRVAAECAALGVQAWSWAPTALGAAALARAGVRNGFARPLAALLDGLPLAALRDAEAHAPVLERMGCRTLGQLRALPRAGLGRRFGPGLLSALDEAYGLRAGAHAWIALPERFHARLELMARVEQAPAMLSGAHRLLLQLCAWLSARRLGLAAFTLRWRHDAMRPRAAGGGGELTVRTASPTRDIGHLGSLLAEHLATVALDAPVGDLELEAVEVRPHEPGTASLLPDARADGESLARVLERIAARLRPERVLRPVLQEDHRPEWSARWRPADAPQPRRVPPRQALPQPSFLLPEPLQLALHGDRPVHQGALLLLSGPHRIEGGWWHRPAEDDGGDADPATGLAVRDYWVALSLQAGVLWIYQTRLGRDRGAWFLHGVFA